MTDVSERAREAAAKFYCSQAFGGSKESELTRLRNSEVDGYIDPLVYLFTEFARDILAGQAAKPVAEGATDNGAPPLSDAERAEAIGRYATPAPDSPAMADDDRATKLLDALNSDYRPKIGQGDYDYAKLERLPMMLREQAKDALFFECEPHVTIDAWNIVQMASDELEALLKPTPTVGEGAEAWPGRNADLQRRRVVTLATLGLMLSKMAGGEAAEVDGFDAAALYADVLMALAIEDADNTDIALEIARDHPEGDTLIAAFAMAAHLRDDLYAMPDEHDAPVSPTPASSDRGEVERIRAEIINTPETADFMAGVPIEAAHQRERWGVDHDAGKTPFDWFWLIGYLAQKAAASAVSGDTEKAKHHTISTAAALANWHAALTGACTAMRPGIGPDNGGEKPGSAHGLASALNKGTTNG